MDDQPTLRRRSLDMQAPQPTLRRRSMDMSGKQEESPPRKETKKDPRIQMRRRSTMEMMQADPSWNNNDKVSVLKGDSASGAVKEKFESRPFRRGYSSIVFFSFLGVSCLFALGLYFVDTSSFTTMRKDDVDAVPNKDYDRTLTKSMNDFGDVPNKDHDQILKKSMNDNGDNHSNEHSATPHPHAEEIVKSPKNADELDPTLLVQKSLESPLISSSTRILDGESLKEVVGECTVSNFISAVGTRATLASYLGSSDTSDDALQNMLDTKCADAQTPTIDLSEKIGKGPQFLKNFFDGGSTWNNNHEQDGSYVLSEDAVVIAQVYDSDAKSSVFAAPDGGTSAHYPRYFSNFYRGDQECPLGVIQCCYTASRLDSNPFSGNADICALDLAEASKSNHIKAMSMTFYNTSAENQAYCSGFAYDKDSFGDSVKYNTLFHMAMKANLYDQGLVRNIPGAPLCGCAEQMPIVDNSECIKAVEGYTIDSDGNVAVNISWDSCGSTLTAYYDSLETRTETEKRFVSTKIVSDGECTAGARSFMNDHMYVPISE